MIADYVAAIKFDIADGISNLKKLDGAGLKSAKGLENRFESVGRKLQGLSGKFAGFSLASAAAFGGSVALFNKAADGASDLEESANAVAVVFGSGSSQILAFGEQAAAQVGLAASEFNQLATSTGALLGRTGKPMEEVADLTIQATERAADLASVFNTDVSDALSAINQAIRGEGEAIRRYAGDVTDATLQNFLFSQGSTKKVKNLSQEEKTLLRLEVILDQTSKVQGDFQNTSESLANQTRISEANFKNISDTIGKQVIPIKLRLVQAVASVLGRFTELSDEQKKQIVNFGLVATAIAGVGAVISPLLFVLGSVAKAFGVATLAAKVLGRALLLNPVGLLITAIGALVFIFKDELAVAFAKAGDVLEPLFKSLDTLKESFSGIAPVLGELLTALAPVGEFFAKNIVASIEIVIGTLTGFIGFIAKAIDKVKELIGSGDSKTLKIQAEYNARVNAPQQLEANNDLFKALGGGSISERGKTIGANNSNVNNNSTSNPVNSANLNQTININGAQSPTATANSVASNTNQGFRSLTVAQGF